MPELRAAGPNRRGDSGAAEHHVAVPRALQGATPTPTPTVTRTYYQNTLCVVGELLVAELSGRNGSTGRVPFPASDLSLSGGACAIPDGPNERQHMYRVVLPADAPLGGQLTVDTCDADTAASLFVGYGCPSASLDIAVFQCAAANVYSAECTSFLGGALARVDYVEARTLCVISVAGAGAGAAGRCPDCA